MELSANNMPPPKVLRPPGAKKKSSETSPVAMSGLAALVAISAAAACYFMHSKVVAISIDDTVALKSVFYSGQPWLVQCSKGRAATQVLSDAEGSLKAARLGVLDCDAVLPSGKTTYQRFKLSPPTSCPVYLAIANMEKPQIVPCNELRSGSHLAAWAAKTTKPKVFAPTTTAAFDSQCLKKAWCVLVLSAGSRLNDAERAAVAALAEAERRVRVVKVDTSNYNLLLDLPSGVPEPRAGHATVVLVKQLEGAEESAPAAAEPDGFGDPEVEAPIAGQPAAAVVLPGGLLDAKAARKALGEALGSEAELPGGLVRLEKRPSLRPKRAPQKAYKSLEPQVYDAPKKEEPASKTLTDGELKVLREERQRMVREREQEQRQRMVAEEEGASNIVEDVPEGEAGTDGGGSPLEAEADDAGDAEEEEEAAEEEEFE